ncbi:contact-dependent growth inhibition system immunity protein [Pseudomonas sp. NPDC089530]|uniref:contact-dependent growth inhibition system immunity protein n=1 Tax=Pseudomonas sp. NPDC089530 TaxID=3390651 RepID=UPI003D0587D8
MSKTFRSIAAGMGTKWESESEPSSLTQWYLSVRDIPIEELELEDLCRALRQGLFLLELLPVAIDVLSQDLLSGFFDDGELLALINDLPTNYWFDSEFLAQGLLSVLVKGKHLLSEEPETLLVAKKLEVKLREVLAK